MQGIDGEVLGITSGVKDRRKPGGDKVSGMVLSGGSVQVTWVGNIEGEGTREVETIGSIEGKVGNKLVISDGEEPGTTIIVSDRSKVGGD